MRLLMFGRDTATCQIVRCFNMLCAFTYAYVRFWQGTWVCVCLDPAGATCAPSLFCVLSVGIKTQNKNNIRSCAFCKWP